MGRVDHVEYAYSRTVHLRRVADVVRDGPEAVAPVGGKQYLVILAVVTGLGDTRAVGINTK